MFGQEEKHQKDEAAAAPANIQAMMTVTALHVEYADRGIEYGILFMFSPLCEYTHLEYVRIHVICRVNQAGYGLHILLVAPQEYVNIYSTRSVTACY